MHDLPAYSLQGEGRPVLVLHGWGGNRNSMHPVTQALCAAGFQVIAPDFAGHGQTPAPDIAWTAEDYAAETAALLDALNIPCCDIIGHSHGGRTAAILAAKYPSRVGRLVLTGSSGIPPRRGVGYYARVYSYKAAKRISRTACGRAVCRLFGVDLAARAQNAGSADYRALTSDAMRKTFVNLVNYDLTELLPAIQAPTLLIWGRQDTAAPLWMGQRMQSLIPDAGLVELEGDHFAYLQQAGQFNRIVLHFLTNTKVA